MVRKKSRTKTGAATQKMPESISPMLCTLVKEVPELDDYLYEIKWDGYRIISFVEKGKVRMASRSGLDYTAKYPLVAKALKALGHELILDGEVVVFNEEGAPDFDAIQLYNGHDTPIQYCVFDILWMDGHDLREMSLTERKSLLEMLVRDNEVLRFSDSFEGGKALYKQVLERNLEGIVAKRKDSQYIEGERGNDWLKIPTRKRQEFVIGGWVESDRRTFKSLPFGAYNEQGKLEWIGRTGGGFKEKEMPAILKKLKKLEISSSPFINPILDVKKGDIIHYVKPELVANIEFATWTKSGRIRKPATFLGFRLDKKAKQVVREIPKPINVVEEEVEDADETERARKQSKKKADSGKQLEAYRDKRHFNKSPEPTGGEADNTKLIFVVQKHHASHLHYDFRLEMRGVLKSWAVPKGPSMNPEDHRLAMAVEDHPYDYKDFEGIIPEGQYGGGTVIIWDHGTYEPAEPVKGKKAQEHWLLSHYYKGSLSIILKGEKLKGKFNISRIKEKGETSWLLTKAKDGKELKRNITTKDRSVVSGMTISEMSGNKKAAIWQSNRGDKAEQRNANQEDEPEVTTDNSSGKQLYKTVGDLYPNRRKVAVESNWKKIFAEKITSATSVEIGGKPLVLTNVEKNIWKGVTKAALIQYYHEIANVILPYLKDRPLSLLIKPHGAMADGLYIKDMEGMQPEGTQIFEDKRRHPKPGKRNTIDYLVCNNEFTLSYLVNLGCIDINPWMSRTGSPEQPDFINIDLDPTKDDFGKVIETALAAKTVLTKYKLKSFVKTSGKTGLHIYIPVMDISFGQARNFSERLGSKIHELVPGISTTNITISQRKDKVLIDPSQNDYADTLACAYSARPHHLPTVSTPLDWKEVKAGLDPAAFTIETIPARIKKKGDLFKEALNPKWARANTNKLLSI